jgi:hypothetical protein
MDFVIFQKNIKKKKKKKRKRKEKKRTKKSDQIHVAMTKMSGLVATLACRSNSFY